MADPQQLPTQDLANPDPDPQDDPSYIDYESFLSPSFLPHQFANTLITSTNDPSDPQLDLSTPLSRVLFDLQEIDTHIHTLTTSSALPLLTHTGKAADASTSIITTVTSQLSNLQSAYDTLSSSIVNRSINAEQVLVVAERLHQTTSILRELGRALVISRQLEVQVQEIQKPEAEVDWRAMVRAGYNLRDLRGLDFSGGGEDVAMVGELRSSVFKPAETFVLRKARESISEFNPSALAGQGGDSFSAGLPGKEEAMRVRASTGALTLYLLSPAEGELLVSAVQSLLNSSVNASLASLSRSLTALTTLEKSVSDVAGRCRNLVTLHDLLNSVPLPGEANDGKRKKMLSDPVLDQLDTPSISTSFFRSVAAGLEPRVRDVVGRGGSNARILKGAKDRLRGALKACVERGLGDASEFEVAVMVAAAGSLGR